MTRRQWKHTKASLIAERDVALELLDGVRADLIHSERLISARWDDIAALSRSRAVHTLCGWFGGVALGLLAGWQL